MREVQNLRTDMSNEKTNSIPKYKIGDKVKFAYDSRHGGYIDYMENVFDTWLYNIESESGYIHRRVHECMIELCEETVTDSDAYFVKNLNGTYNIEELSDGEFRAIQDVLIKREPTRQLGMQMKDFYEYIKDK